MFVVGCGFFCFKIISSKPYYFLLLYNHYYWKLTQKLIAREQQGPAAPSGPGAKQLIPLLQWGDRADLRMQADSPKSLDDQARSCWPGRSEVKPGEWVSFMSRKGNRITQSMASGISCTWGWGWAWRWSDFGGVYGRKGLRGAQPVLLGQGADSPGEDDLGFWAMGKVEEVPRGLGSDSWGWWCPWDSENNVQCTRLSSWLLCKITASKPHMDFWR